jgi:replicative DNA helicase
MPNTSSWQTSIQDTISLIKSTDASKICTYPIPALNAVLGGIGRGEVVVIAGQSGEGKSDLLRLTAEENARKGRTVHMYQFEMDKDENIRRFLLRRLNEMRAVEKESPISALDLFLNKITPWDHLRLDTISKEESVKDFPLYTYSGKPLSVTEFLTELSDSLKMNPPELIALDHIHYFSGDEGAQEAESLSLAMREIRQWTRETHVPIIIAAHLRKLQKKTDEASPHDIYGSSNIFKECTTCILIRRKQSETTFSIWKSRVGADYKRFEITYDNMTKMWSGAEKNMRTVFEDQLSTLEKKAAALPF